MDAQEFDQRKAQANLSLARSCDPADEMRLDSIRDAALRRTAMDDFFRYRDR